MTAAILRHVTPIMDRITPLFRHLAPLLSIRAPIIAGAVTAGILVLGLGIVALFGNDQIAPPSATGDVSPVAADAGQQPNTQIVDGSQGNRGIEFVDTGDGSEASLAGVSDGFRTTGQTAQSAAQDERRALFSSTPDSLQYSPGPGLSEPGPGGLLPVIAANGTRPSRAYARPFHGDPTAPSIALVIGGMGLNAAVTQSAIDDLPPEVALSFAPYTQDLQTWIDRARLAGHEVLIEAPMEPFDYPNNDPGPNTLLADGSAAENERRLAWLLSRVTGYFAVTNYLGARFSASENALEALFTELEERGVAFLHDGAGRRSTLSQAANTANIEYAIADRILDDEPSRDTIDSRLLALEALALQNGAALGSGFAYPATVELVQAWAEDLDTRGYQLAPPSAIMARRRLEAIRQAEIEAARPPSPTRQSRPAPAEDHAPAASSGH
jgi:polysaccharide deacetylase 2 family uncharacterized protein YibQ